MYEQIMLKKVKKSIICEEDNSRIKVGLVFVVFRWGRLAKSGFLLFGVKKSVLGLGKPVLN